MSDRRLTPTQFRGLYRYALNPVDDNVHENTRRSLINMGLLRFDHLASLGEKRPYYTLTGAGHRELDAHVLWLGQHRHGGRAEFERRVGADISAARVELNRAYDLAAQLAQRAHRTGVLFLRTDPAQADRIVAAQELPADEQGRVWLFNRREAGDGDALLRVALPVEESWEREQHEDGVVRYAVPAEALRNRVVYRL